MSLVKKITFNTIIQFSTKIIGLVLGLITVGLMTRYLGREGFGQYSTIIAFLGFFGVLADFGLSLVLIQMVSHLKGVEENKIFNNIFTLRFFSIISFLFLASLIAFFVPTYSPLIKLGIVLTAFSFLFASLRDITVPLFQKRLSMKSVALGEIIGRLLLLCFTIVAINFKMGLLAILGAIILGNLVNFLFIFFSAQKFIKFSFEFDFSLWKEIFQRSWPMAFSIFFNLIYFRADTLILSLLKTQEEVGIYGAPYKILETLSMFPLVFVGLILPILAKNWQQKSIDQFRKTLQNSFDFLVSISLPMIIGILFLARKIMIFVAGDEFAISAGVLKILILATGIIFIAALFTHTIVALNKQKQMLWVYLFSALIGLIGYLIFIPQYSYWAAAWMTVITEGLVGLGAFIIVWRTSKATLSLRFFWKDLGACLVMAGFLWFLGDWNLLVLLLLSGVSYFGMLYLLGGIPEKLKMQSGKA